jgi:predicted  nucleic acid-binding Zn-ribbon protein
VTKERGDRGQIDEDLLGVSNVFSQGDAVVVAEHEVCTGCHMKVTTQTAHRAKAGKEIVSCDNCGRILYDAA